MCSIAQWQRHKKISLAEMWIGKDICHLVNRRRRNPPLLTRVKQFRHVPSPEPILHQQRQCIGIAAAQQSISENLLFCPLRLTHQLHKRLPLMLLGSGNYRSPSCSSSDRPVVSQTEAYTALISAVVRGLSSVAFEPISFIT